MKMLILLEGEQRCTKIFFFDGKGAVKFQEVQRLTVEINMANEKWDALMQSKMHQESAIRELKMEIGSLTEQNHSSELLIQQLRDCFGFAHVLLLINGC
uniref:Uncharacterized protein n=1 Tax=Aegilops tauschii subsp. strangulata TaxID=200361 RepID=A0A453LEJ9_AEGTS